MKGRLLVATPDLGDPNFERAVVLMLEHTEEGGVGIILNRPSDTPLGEAGAEWDGWDELAADPAVVYVGGPVSPTAVICLARPRKPSNTERASAAIDGAGGFQPVLGDVGVADLTREPDNVDAVRLFAGYSGWGAGQLEGEVAAGAWFVIDADPGDALTDDPGTLWRDVLRRQQGRLALFAACPADPTLN
jgi:putative transcriptional regulator